MMVMYIATYIVKVNTYYYVFKSVVVITMMVMYIESV